MEELAIKIEHVSKQYRLGAIGGGTLKGDLQSWWARKRGKEDPNSKIGARTDIKIGERFLALDDINLEVKKGEALGIIGHNGAGKSTLLKLLSRVTAPTTGKISYNGRITSMLEVGTGFHPELTGRENIYMNGAILGLTKAEIDAKMEDIIEFSEVRQFIDTPVKRYSSGMYVKLAFSVAAHLDSEIMIMDEVLAVGDMAFQKKCLNKMREAADKEGRTVLYVSHNMNTIRRLCNRCIVMDHGKSIFDGDVDEAISIYMTNNKQTDVHNVFDNTRNPGYQLDQKLVLKYATLLDKEYPVFDVRDEFDVEIGIEAKQKTAAVAIRFTVLSAEQTVVGLATTAPCVSLREGEQSVTVHFCPVSLAPGKYYINLIAYSVNEYGGEQLHDVVESAFSFDYVQGDTNNRMNWNPTYWGYHMFPVMKVLKQPS